MRGPADQLPTPPEGPPVSLFGGLLIPFLGLGLLHGVMSLFDTLLA
jgi:hypothetical protein